MGAGAKLAVHGCSVDSWNADVDDQLVGPERRLVVTGDQLLDGKLTLAARRFARRPAHRARTASPVDPTRSPRPRAHPRRSPDCARAGSRRPRRHLPAPASRRAPPTSARPRGGAPSRRAAGRRPTLDPSRPGTSRRLSRHEGSSRPWFIRIVEERPAGEHGCLVAALRLECERLVERARPEELRLHRLSRGPARTAGGRARWPARP